MSPREIPLGTKPSSSSDKPKFQTSPNFVLRGVYAEVQGKFRTRYDLYVFALFLVNCNFSFD